MTYHEAVKAALSTVNVPYYHNKAYKAENEYIVWSEASTRGLHADNKIRYRSQRIAVDFFTKTEYSGIPAIIQAALEVQGFVVNSEIVPIFEEDTGYTHYAMTAEWG